MVYTLCSWLIRIVSEQLIYLMDTLSSLPSAFMLVNTLKLFIWYYTSG